MQSYGKLCTQYYDLDKPAPPPDALTFYLKQAGAASGPILEPMCGSGRFLIPLMQAGFEVTGVDPSHAMLKACRLKAKALGLNPILYPQFLHEMEVPGSFALALIPSGSFGLITNETEASQSLGKIYQQLSPGGRLILELDHLSEEAALLMGSGESSVTRSDGAQIKRISSGEYDPVERVFHGINVYELIEQGQSAEQELEHFNLRYYEPGQITHLLEKSGFSLLALHTAFDHNIPISDSKSFVLIASKC